ncbi:MAG TPA: beta-ketoacyl synthase N-terminal-like domain-containing protein, partial [Sandaracinaceae bacterium]
MSQSPKIAVVGLACLFPGSSDLEGFWRDILARRDRIGPVPRTHWLVEDYYDPDPKAPDKIYVDRGGFLDPIAFDPVKWGIPPSILPATDTTQLLALVVAERALHDAFGEAMEGIDRERVSVLLGVTSAQKLLGEMNSRLQRPIWRKALREMGLSEAQVEEACRRIADHYVPWQESTFPGVLGNVVAGRIANRLDLGGTNCVVDAACASAFGALSMAVAELALGHADVAICGGADTMNDPFMFECFAKTTALSKRGDCRPFDASADGTMLGEGVGIVVLERLEDAEKAGHPIYAVIRGVGTSSDGRAKSVYAPLPSGQAKALRRAYERAGYGPDTIELVEAHGTGTAAGDAAELEALVEVFSEARGDSRWCAIGSVKSQIGHTKAAAGAAGLIKAVLALRHGILPPTIKVERPTRALAEDGPFYVSTHARPWIRGGDHPRRASVSSFGFGGANFHVTLEEYVGERRAPRLPIDAAHLVALSAGDARALSARVRALLPDARTPGMLRWLAYESARSFEAGAPARLALVAESEDELAEQLETALPFLDRGEPFGAPGGLEIALGEGGAPLALLFPGQGSQYLEMGAALAARFSCARAVWDRAADAPFGPVHRVVFPPPSFDEREREEAARRLTATEWAQPAIGVASAAALAVLRALGVEAAAYAGHSFGEVSALHAAGALSEADFLRVARERGERMAEAAKSDGAMLAVSARIEDVRAIVREASLAVTVANHNHPEQVVLSGTTDAIARAEEALRERRVRASRLDVATAFHSPIVAASREPFARFLETIEIGPLSAPVYANATAAPYEASAVRETLAAQIAEPVRFVEQIEAMYADGIRTFVEVGPGSVLTGLVARILTGRPHRAIALDRKGASGLRPFLVGIAKMAAAGVPLALGALFDEERAPTDPRAIEKPRMTIPLGGANVGKPYPPSEGHGAAASQRALAPPGVPRGVAATPAQGAPAAAGPAERGRADASGDGSPARANGARASGEPAHRSRDAGRAPPGATAAASDRGRAAAAAPRASIDHAMNAKAAHPDLVHAFVETQRQTAEAHAAYQRAVADAHAAFLRTSEATMRALAALLGAQDGAATAARLHDAPAAPADAQDLRAAAPRLEHVSSEAPTPTDAPLAASPPAVAAPSVHDVAPEPSSSGVDLLAVLLEVVAQKTG